MLAKNCITQVARFFLLSCNLRSHKLSPPFLSHSPHPCTASFLPFLQHKFRHSGGLTEHAAVHRHKEDKQHRCTQCSNSYKTRAELSRHKKQHTRDSEYLLPESPSSSVSEPSHTPFPGGSLSGMPSLDTELNSCPGTLIPQPLTGTYVFESAGPTHYVIHLAPISVSATGTDVSVTATSSSIVTTRLLTRMHSYVIQNLGYTARAHTRVCAQYTSAICLGV